GHDKHSSHSYSFDYNNLHLSHTDGHHNHAEQRSSTYRNRAIPERRDTHQRNGYLHGAKWPAEYDGIGHAHGHAHHNSFGASDRPRKSSGERGREHRSEEHTSELQSR